MVITCQDLIWDDLAELLEQTEDTSRERGVEIQLRAEAQRCHPEDATDPMMAPQDCGRSPIRESPRTPKTVISGYDPQTCPWHFSYPHDHS